MHNGTLNQSGRTHNTPMCNKTKQFRTLTHPPNLRKVDYTDVQPYRRCRWGRTGRWKGWGLMCEWGLLDSRVTDKNKLILVEGWKEIMMQHQVHILFSLFLCSCKRIGLIKYTLYGEAILYKDHTAIVIPFFVLAHLDQTIFWILSMVLIPNTFNNYFIPVCSRP